MLFDQLRQIADDGKASGFSADVIKIQLKEFLIFHALNFIYNSPKWSDLVFTGGTALRILGKTARLSEDLDLDCLAGSFDCKKFSGDLVNYFSQQGLKDTRCSLKSKEKVVLIKFPVLHSLGLTEKNNLATDLLHLKIEIEINRYSSYGIQMTPVSAQNLFFVAKHYDFPTLFSNKIGAILGRKGKIFHGIYDFRGRDFYDLIWFLENGYLPNLKRAKEILKAERAVQVKNCADIWKLIGDRIEKIDTKGIYQDLKNLVPADQSLKKLSENFSAIFKQLTQKPAERKQR